MEMLFMSPFTWILIIGAIAVVVWLFLRKRGAKEQVAQAKILDKKAVAHQPRGNDDDSFHTDCIVNFQIANKNLSLIVNRSFYDSVQVGAEGKLTFKKDVFIDFEDNNPRTYR